MKDQKTMWLQTSIDIAKIFQSDEKQVTDSHCESSVPKVKVLFGWLKSVASVVVLTHDSPMMFVAFSEARWTYGGGKKINFPMWSWSWS